MSQTKISEFCLQTLLANFVYFSCSTVIIFVTILQTRDDVNILTSFMGIRNRSLDTFRTNVPLAVSNFCPFLVWTDFDEVQHSESLIHCMSLTEFWLNFDQCLRTQC